MSVITKRQFITIHIFVVFIRSQNQKSGRNLETRGKNYDVIFFYKDFTATLFFSVSKTESHVELY